MRRKVEMRRTRGNPNVPRTEMKAAKETLHQDGEYLSQRPLRKQRAHQQVEHGKFNIKK